MIDRVDDTQETPRAETDERGFCIRCRADVPLDRDQPYCAKDSNRWDGEEDDYFCHRCGERYDASFERPLCTRCFTHPREKSAADKRSE